MLDDNALGWKIVLKISQLSSKLHRTLFYQHRSNPNCFNTDADNRPKNFCLGLIRPKVSYNECLWYFLYWQTVICVFYPPQINLGDKTSWPRMKKIDLVWEKMTWFGKKSTWKFNLTCHIYMGPFDITCLILLGRMKNLEISKFAS